MTNHDNYSLFLMPVGILQELSPSMINQPFAYYKSLGEEIEVEGSLARGDKASLRCARALDCGCPSRRPLSTRVWGGGDWVRVLREKDWGFQDYMPRVVNGTLVG